MTQHFYERAIYSKVIRKLSDNNNIITHTKAHKLAYLCYAKLLIVGLEKHNIVFESWENGPVNRAIYGSIRRMYNHNYIKFAENYNSDNELSEEELMCIDSVINIFGGLKEEFLSELTHEDIIYDSMVTPWAAHYLKENKTNFIPSREIKDFYNEEWWKSISSQEAIKSLYENFGEKYE